MTPSVPPAPLPNLWSLYNLTESPYFQETLAADDTARRRPMDLFVGREEERQRVLLHLGSSSTSRQTVQGPPGIGKTTLVQYAKAQAEAAGILSYHEPIAVGQIQSADALAAQILNYVCRALLARGGALQDPALTEARRLVHVYQVHDYAGGVTVGHVGVSAGRTTQVTLPPGGHAAMLVGGLLRRLVRVAEEKLGKSGFLIHLNNLDQVTDGDAKRAGRALRELRDSCLLADRCHWIVVGTTDAIGVAINAQPQLRSVFAIGQPLAPLSEHQFDLILDRRYAYMQRDRKMPVIHPVSRDATHELYRLFRGDLRGTLRALDEATHILLGFGQKGVAAPLGTKEVLAALAPRYVTEMANVLTPRAAKYLTRLGARKRKTPITQAGLRQEWKVAQSTVSSVVNELQRLDYLAEDPGVGEGQTWTLRRQRQYVLTGNARLIFAERG